MSTYEKLNEMTQNDIRNLSLEISKTLIKDPKYEPEIVLENLTILEVVLALNTIFDFNEVNYVVDHGNKRHVQQILESNLNVESSKIYYSENPSDSLAIATAIALKSQILTLVLVNDFIMNNGKSFETLKLIENHQPNLIIVYLDEHNQLLSHYGRMDTVVKNIRISKSYSNIKQEMKSFLSNPIGKPILNTLSKVKEGMKDFVLEPTIFKQFNVEYHGPISGNNYAESFRALDRLKNLIGTHLLHINTDIKPLQNLNLPSFKTQDSIPDNYINAIDTVDHALAEFEDIILVNDITKNSEHYAEFAIKYPDNYYVSTGSYASLIAFTKGLILLRKKVVLSIKASTFKYLSALFEEQLAKENNILVILHESGLLQNETRSLQGIFDISLAALFTESVYMGESLNTTRNMIEMTLRKDEFPLTIIRVQKTHEPQQSLLKLENFNWETRIKKEDPKGLLITYGPSVLQFERKIRNNNLNVDLINAKSILTLDLNLLYDYINKNIPIYIYDIEDINHTLYNKIAILDNVSVSNFTIKDVKLNGSIKKIKDNNNLSVDAVLTKIIE